MLEQLEEGGGGGGEKLLECSYKAIHHCTFRILFLTFISTTLSYTSCSKKFPQIIIYIIIQSISTPVINVN